MKKDIVSDGANRTHPFLKWVGGKGRLLAQLRDLYPKEFNVYFEPFLGGGAVYFDLSPKKAYLNDINSALISTYSYLQKEPFEVIAILEPLQKKYLKLGEEKRKDFYYKIRNDFNSLKENSVTKSAYLIFLNKTGYNGMYRENSKGGFNVPFGRQKKPRILDEENILEISKQLQSVKFSSGSFEDSVSKAGKGDFVYFDPPYFPISKTSDFTGYTQMKFLKDEQIKLYELFANLDKKGCKVMLSNSDTPFIRELYKKYDQHKVLASRAINCKAAGRGKITELVIVNYKV